MGERVHKAHTVGIEQPSPQAELRIIIVPLDGSEPTRWKGSQRRRPNFFELLRTRLIRRPRGRPDQTPDATKERSS